MGVACKVALRRLLEKLLTGVPHSTGLQAPPKHGAAEAMCTDVLAPARLVARRECAAGRDPATDQARWTPTTSGFGATRNSTRGTRGGGGAAGGGCWTERAKRRGGPRVTHFQRAAPFGQLLQRPPRHLARPWAVSWPPSSSRKGAAAAEDARQDCAAGGPARARRATVAGPAAFFQLTKDQRLVYSGRLLPDHLQLKDILRKQDEYHMVHLVCTSRTPPSSPKSSTTRESHEALASSSNSNSDQSGSTTPSSSQETLSLSASSSSEGLRQRTLPQAQTDPAQTHQFPYVMQGNVDNQLPGQAIPAGFPVYPAFSPLQMLWWQQMYAHQYYMQ
uniref:homocysteine-responsive endoplasmic reticulum-resident ubiquitin-like domain member 2 protein n=1 Tax=Panthera onca TaxID=9690 RepID=UPI002953E876|nr:homocysteine-responsive endoplasmic reticulum-resident ubiquitin-like domain member 2 protein [Panthera onca]